MGVLCEREDLTSLRKPGKLLHLDLSDVDMMGESLMRYIGRGFRVGGSGGSSGGSSGCGTPT